MVIICVKLGGNIEMNSNGPIGGEKLLCDNGCIAKIEAEKC